MPSVAGHVVLKDIYIALRDVYKEEAFNCLPVHTLLSKPLEILCRGLEWVRAGRTDWTAVNGVHTSPMWLALQASPMWVHSL